MYIIFTLFKNTLLKPLIFNNININIGGVNLIPIISVKLIFLKRFKATVINLILE